MVYCKRRIRTRSQHNLKACYQETCQIDFHITDASYHNSTLSDEVTKRVYFTGNERMLIAHDSNRLRFS